VSLVKGCDAWLKKKESHDGIMLSVLVGCTGFEPVTSCV